MRTLITAIALLAMLSTGPVLANPPAKGVAQATFAGGCFWCTEAMFEQLKGVKNVTAGLMGGQEEGLTQEQILKGEGGHAEVVFLIYDPSEISYAELLEAFFMAHDPTSLNKQGEDEGVEYRSAIFYFDDAQKKAAESAIAELTKEGIYDKPIVTEVAAAGKFYAAPEKHQDYYSKKSDAAYCDRVITPKVEKFRKIFADKVKATP